MALTLRQDQFVAEYLVDLNATQAAIRAGYSEKTAYSMGQRLLKNVEIQNAIMKARKKLEARTEITQDKVLKELAKIALDDSIDFASEGLPIIPEARYKGSSKIKALELIGKHLGMFDQSAKKQEDENNLLSAIAETVEEDIDTDEIPEVE